MSHLTCASCGGNEHFSGYGMAGGVYGGYTICACEKVLELFPDTQGLTDEQVKAAKKAAADITQGAVR